ncbi:MAG: hypothetical protein AAGF45_02520 [Pseudomonadota bacterium]
MSEEPAKPLTKSQEARIKLLSDFINRVAVNFVTFGFFTPAALLLDQFSAPVWLVVIISAAFVTSAGALYIVARGVLGRLD